MFTGLVETLGHLASFEPHSAGASLRINAPDIMPGVKEGDSIAVNGVCLTAVRLDANSFAADLAPETLARTNLGALKTGDVVNLEQSLAAGARLGGHILQGHVDGRGELIEIRELGDGNWWLRILLPEDLERYFVFKGSIAIDGISLTVAAVNGCEISITIIPHTWAKTNLHRRQAGEFVNVEVDIIAKYVEKMLGSYQIPAPR